MPLQILEVPSKLFYSNCLVAKATFPLNGPQDIPPVGFVGVDGQEKRDEDSPSFLNLLEAEKVAAKVSCTSNRHSMAYAAYKSVCTCKCMYM